MCRNSIRYALCSERGLPVFQFYATLLEGDSDYTMMASSVLFCFIAVNTVPSV